MRFFSLSDSTRRSDYSTPPRPRVWPINYTNQGHAPQLGPARIGAAASEAPAGAADGAQLAEGHRAAVLLEGPPDVQQPPERVLDLLLLAQLVREARPLWRLDTDDVLLARRRRREGEEALVDQLLRHAVVCLEGGGVGVHQVEAAVHRRRVDRLTDAAANLDARRAVLPEEGGERADPRQLLVVHRRDGTVGRRTDRHPRAVLEQRRAWRGGERREGGRRKGGVAQRRDLRVAEAGLCYRQPDPLAAVQPAVYLDEDGSARRRHDLGVHR